MKKTSKVLRLLASIFVVLVLFIGCSDDDDDDAVIVPTDPTMGTLVIAVAPGDNTITVNGPNNFSFTDGGEERYTLSDIEPGAYTVDASAVGFASQRQTANVVAGEASVLTFTLVAEPGEPGERQAFFVDATGQLVEIPESAFDSPDNFVFYAWLEDEDGGIMTAPIAGAPTADEQFEIAPSGTQNLAAAFVGFRMDGTIFPVVNAAVRWEIDRQFDGAVGSVQFGAADDGSSTAALSLATRAIDDDQADTFTNTANVRNRSRFPVTTDFPLHNVTGVSTPDTDGFTWVTLFSPDVRATARVVAVASVNETEVGKEILVKNFAPVPELSIDKTVVPETVVLAPGGTARVTFTVTVANTGDGDAFNIVHRDRQTEGPLTAYSLDTATLPAGANPVDQDEDGDFEGFNIRLPELLAGESVTFSFDAIITTADAEYCNLIRIAAFETEFERVTTNISDDACVNVLAPRLSIVKDFVGPDGMSLGDELTVAADEPATLRVQVINNGTADATGVVVRDALTDVLGGGDAAAYRISALPSGATPVGTDGFDLSVGTLAATDAVTLTFAVQANVNGTYCDTASFTSDNAGSGQDTACLTVATPALTIAKSNSPTTVIPGTTYESTVMVTNSGSADAREVVISDRIGFNSGAGLFVELVSSSLDGTAGTLSDNTVTFPARTIVPGETVTVTITSRIPEGAPAGEYCDIARFTSANAGSGEARACVTVPAFAGIQASLNDARDPATGGETTTFNSTLYNEDESNERVINNRIVYTYGTGLVIRGRSLFFDPTPTTDPDTGTVVSGPESNPDVQRLTEGQDFTVTSTGPGSEEIVLARELDKNTAFYVVHTIEVPVVGVTTAVNSSFLWTAMSQSGLPLQIRPDESSTIIP